MSAIAVEINLPDPHSKKQGTIMKALSMRGVSEVWVANGTKYGKTCAASCAVCSAAPLKKQALFRWIAPIYMQSKIGYKYCRRMLPTADYVKTNDSEPSITFHGGIDTRIEFYHGQKPESLEGEATAGNVLDEAAKMREEVYASVKTTTTVTRGKIICISTPFGKNWFYKGCMLAKEEMERAHAEGRTPTKLFITAPSTDNPKVSAEAIAEARQSLPERLFRQYYLAEFVDDGSVFSGFRDCQYGLHMVFANPNNQRWVSSEARTLSVVVGADWAKTKDWTVFTAIDLATRKCIAFYRFHNLSYTDAIRELVRFCKEFQNVECVLHDKTGVGMAIDDQLAYTHLPYRGVTFTNTKKAEMVSRLITAFEQKLLPIPRWVEMERELDAFEVQSNSLGRMMYSAPAGQHDDIVCSLMLANAAYLENMGDADITFLEDIATETAGIDSLEAYYNDIIEDD